MSGYNATTVATEDLVRPRRLFRFFLSFLLIFPILIIGGWLIAFATKNQLQFNYYYQPFYFSVILFIAIYNFLRFSLLAYEWKKKHLFKRINFTPSLQKKIPVNITKKVIQASILAGIIFNSTIILGVVFDWIKHISFFVKHF